MRIHWDNIFYCRHISISTFTIANVIVLKLICEVINPVCWLQILRRPAAAFASLELIFYFMADFVNTQL